MYRDHEQLNCIEDHVVLWKYMDFLKLFNILLTGKIWFNRIDSFEDVYEGVYPNANVQLRHQVYGEKEMIPQSVYDQVEDFARTRLYVTCWHENNYESAAMWTLYGDRSGVAIKTSGEKIKRSFDKESREIHVARVDYLDYNTEFLPERNIMYLGLTKRKNFEHEKEVRCIVMLPSSEDLNQTPSGFYCKIDILKLIEEIYISPYAPLYAEETIKKLLKSMNLEIPVQKSSLLQK